MSASKLAAGHTIAGKYAIFRRVRRSPSGVTYHALTPPDREVEVRVLDAELGAHPRLEDLLRRCLEETNSLPENVALRVLEVGRDEDTGAPFIVTELGKATPLAELVQQARLGPTELVAFARSLAVALDTAHERGVLHAALAPDNVLVGPAPRFDVRLTDFDGALESLLGPDRLPTLFRGEPPTVGTDVLGAAQLLLFAVSGATLDDTSEAALFAPATTVAKKTRIDLDPRLDAALARAYSRDPARRHGRASDLAEAVARAFGIAPAKRRSSRRMVAVSVPRADDESRGEAQVGTRVEPSVPGGAAGAAGSAPDVEVPGNPLDGRAPMPTPEAASADQVTDGRAPTSAPSLPPASTPYDLRAPAGSARAPDAYGSALASPGPLEVQPTRLASMRPALATPPFAAPASAAPGFSAAPPAAPAFAAPYPESAMAAVPLPPSVSPAVNPPSDAVGAPAAAPRPKLGMVAGALAVAALAVGAVGWGLARGRSYTATAHAEPPPQVAAAASHVVPPVTAALTASAPSQTTPTPAASTAPAPGASETASAATAAAAPEEPRSALLTVACTPECSSVTIDGEAVTVFPASLAPGAHSVVAQRGSHAPQKKRVTLTAGKPETVAIVWRAPSAEPAPKKSCGKFLKRCD